ncbi:Abietadienol/abietadienal oxidase [Glycine soja]|nr:Abietadienol/abietadienal oxidase [Glycine soja]
MESVPTIVYYGGDMISSSERILFEYPNGSQVIRISENISLDALRKIIMDAIQGSPKASLNVNKEQEEVLRSKPSILALIDELDKLRQPLATALSEELQINGTSSQNPHHETETENETLAESSGSIEPNSNSRNDVVVEDLLNFLYFGSLFDVKSDFVSTMLTRTHERGCCLTYDYVTDDATDLLGEKDLDSISALRGLLVLWPVDSSFSHKNVLHRCVEHAKLWLAKSELLVPDADVTSVHLDENVYSGALNINPWRWMEPENEEKRNWRTSPFYAPFGGGARFCLGAELARL